MRKNEQQQETVELQSSEASAQLPYFRYHPDPFRTEVFHKDKTVICDCCGKPSAVYYDGVIYSRQEVEYLCPDCIASGKAAEKFDGEFVQDAAWEDEVTDQEKREELFKRTPGYISWQGEYWLSCCQDFCAYLGTVGARELKEMGIYDEVLEEYNTRGDFENVGEYLEKDGSLCGYLFQCLHCGKYHLWVDAD